MIAFFSVMLLCLLAAWWLEEREENGATERARIDRMADESRKAAMLPRKRRCTKYSQIGWKPSKRKGGKHENHKSAA